MGLDCVDDFSFLKKAYLDFNGKWKKASASFCDYLGYSEKELLSIKLSYVSHPEDIANCRKLLSGSTETVDFDIRFIHKSGKILWANIIATLVHDMWGDPKFIAMYVTDITKYKNLEPQLEQQIEWIQQFLNWHHLVEDSPLPILISIDGKIKFINKSGLHLFGFDNENEIVNKSLFDFFKIEKSQGVPDKNQHSLPTISERHIFKPGGEEVIVKTHSVPVQYENQEALQTVFYDITEAKEKVQQTTVALKERETLLQEIHHRVKNNLAVISGLLELQVMNMSDEKVKDILRESQLRIQSIALIHEKLYKSPNLSDIAFDNYARELVDTVVKSYQLGDRDIQVRYDLDNIDLDITKAIPAALALNELVSNCYKHAFIEQKHGKIKISIKKLTGEIMMSVSDNGVGIPDDFSMKGHETLGIRLIRRLSKQLGGGITYESINGTTFTLNFPDSE